MVLNSKSNNNKKAHIKVGLIVIALMLCLLSCKRAQNGGSKDIVNSNQNPKEELLEWKAYYNNGIARTKNNEFLKAEESFNKAIKLSPNNGLLYYYRAGVKKSLLKVMESHLDYNKAIELGCKNDSVYFERANLLRLLEKFKESIDDYSQAIELNSEFVEAYNNRGIAKMHLELFKDAIEDFTMAINIDNNFTKAYSNRANSYLLIDMIDNACSDWNKAFGQGDANANSMLGKYCESR